MSMFYTIYLVRGKLNEFTENGTTNSHEISVYESNEMNDLPKYVTVEETLRFKMNKPEDSGKLCDMYASVEK